jgi:hypothetical protein
MKTSQQNMIGRINPWLSIWVKTEETIDRLKDSNWANRQGLLIYSVVGINSVVDREMPQLLESSWSKVTFAIVVIVAGIIFGMLVRIFWINLIFYFGKIWKGQATKRNIDTVLALSFIPEIIRFLNLTLRFFIDDNLTHIQIHEGLTIICVLVSLSILLIGLSRVQRFTFGICLLNILLPSLSIWILAHLIFHL